MEAAIIKQRMNKACHEAGMLEQPDIKYPLFDIFHDTVYPAFLQRHWPEEARGTFFTNIKPALGLASKLLFLQGTWPWWIKLCVGEYGFVSDLDPRCSSYIRDVIIITEASAEARDALAELSNYVRIKIRSPDEEERLKETHSNMRLITGPAPEGRPRQLPFFAGLGFEGKDASVLISLSRGYLDYFSRPQDQLPPGEATRVLFFLALRLVRHVAKAIEVLRFRGQSRYSGSIWHTISDDDPNVSDSWEKHVFEWTLYSSVPRTGQQMWERAHWYQSPKDPDRKRGVPTEYLQEFLSRFFWEQRGETFKLPYLSPPVLDWKSNVVYDREAKKKVARFRQV